MKAHFDCIASLEKELGGMKNATRLREVLKHNSFQLGLQSYLYKQRELELKFYLQNS